ncbi:hypothetical protein Cgig2_016844 [Carnegiea gigantea]|uniref:Uncharacterized protein n=1 Tax=Carnegiea gigantea TaxID=171969 RepID=A0A9Q1JKI4_9CARY|nr:hypothetical protein Cgig2_016844 [Carnegiea gigantea]
MARKKGSSSKDPGRPLTDYEKERHMTMEKNATILEKLGLPKLLNQMREIKKGYTKKGSEHNKGIDKDKEYMPSDEASESEEDSENDNVDDVLTSKGAALNGKKQSEVTMHKNKKLSKCPAISMNDFLIQQQEQQQQQHSAMKHLHEASQTEKPNIEAVPVSLSGTTPTIVQQKQQHLKCPAMSMIPHSVVQPDKASSNAVELGSVSGTISSMVDVQQLEEGMLVQIDQRRRSKRQAAIALDATRRASDDQVVIAPSNVLTAEHLNEPDIEDEPVKKRRGPTISKNVESRQQQDNMHTMGPVSFARKYYDLKRMKEIEALQESGLSSSDEDPFDKVMKKECPRRLRLYGRGVCTTNLKRNDVDKPQALAPEFIDAIRVGLSEEMQKDFDAHKEKMDVELKAERDKVANMQKELDSQKAVLDAQKTELDSQKAKVDHLLLQLQKMIPGITPENIAQAVTSQFTSTSATPVDGSTT